MSNYPKLVRDKIPEIIAAAGKVAAWHKATDEEFRTELYKKLKEEVAELAAAPSLDEAADVYEVILRIRRLEGWSWGELEERHLARRRQRGAFEKRIIIDSVS